MNALYRLLVAHGSFGAWGLNLIGYQQPLKGWGGGIFTPKYAPIEGSTQYRVIEIATCIYQELHPKQTGRQLKQLASKIPDQHLPSPFPHTHVHLLPTNVECNTFHCGWFLSKPESCHLKQGCGATERMISSWRHICDTHIQVREHFNTRELRIGYPF